MRSIWCGVNRVTLVVTVLVLYAANWIKCQGEYEKWVDAQKPGITDFKRRAKCSQNFWNNYYNGKTTKWPLYQIVVALFGPTFKLYML